MPINNPDEEYWLNGPVAGIPFLLQPVAHALLQSQREIDVNLQSFDERLLWRQPAGVASVAFHLQHIPGVLDRLQTYSQGKTLSPQQLKYLSEEGLEMGSLRLSGLLDRLNGQFGTSLAFLQGVDPDTLVRARGVGRKQLPSTVLGLLFHAAEHTMRHTGQLIVTARVAGGI